MSYSIDMEEFGEIITLNNSQNKKQNYFEVEEKLFNFKMQEVIFSDYISLVKWEMDAKEDFEIHGNYQNDALHIHIGLEGKIHQVEKNTNSCLDIKQNEIFCTSVKEVKGKEVYQRGICSKALNISLKKDFFQIHFPDIADKVIQKLDGVRFYKILKSKRAYYQALSCANAIFQAPIENKIDELYLYGKTMEMLSYELNELLFLTKKKENMKVKFDEYEKSALEKAKIFLYNNSSNPPSLQELSKLVKLNEFKLKYGFKVFFKTTPYNYLLHVRMEKAKRLLEVSEYSVSEIAQIVGYKQASNFTKSFVKFYGILPKEVMKQRNFYY